MEGSRPPYPHPAFLRPPSPPPPVLDRHGLLLVLGSLPLPNVAPTAPDLLRRQASRFGALLGLAPALGNGRDGGWPGCMARKRAKGDAVPSDERADKARRPASPVPSGAGGGLRMTALASLERAPPFRRSAALSCSPGAARAVVSQSGRKPYTSTSRPRTARLPSIRPTGVGTPSPSALLRDPLCFGIRFASGSDTPWPLAGTVESSA